MTLYGVILFYTTSSVLRAEKRLHKDGFATKLVPTPRQFSSDCGIALRFDWNDHERITSILEEEKVEFDAIHFLDTNRI
jgi:hypothetical protein